MTSPIFLSSILITVSFLVACSTQYRPSKLTLVEEENIKDRDILIFIPGYKGSKLLDKSTNSVVWIDFHELLFGSQSIGFKSSIAEDTLLAIDVLDKVEILPGLYDIDIYDDCLKNLSKLNESRFNLLTFPYDWRKSNIETAKSLKSFLKEISVAKPKSISIIAHSMGGLALAYMLGESQDLPKIDSIAFITVPFRGALRTFVDMQRELEPLFFNDHLYARKDFVSFPAAYELLPHPTNKTFTNFSESNSEVLYQGNFWKENHWGPFRKSSMKSAKELENDQNILSSRLNSANLIFSRLDSNKSTCPTKILGISGIGNRIPNKINFDFKIPLSKRDLETMDANSVDGDGLISLESSKLPIMFQSCNSTEIEVENIIHDRACNDNKVIQLLDEFFKDR